MMSLKNFLYLVGVLFGAKVLVILAVWLGWGMDVLWNAWQMPVWLALLGIIVDAYLSWQAFVLARKAM